ncbi:hypothetical protein [Neomoorella thermoacetica]|uniref:hypothetical protein n=1 Tax=Neomoorella thermoacetica TaxID=1525 RepID=UPI0030D04ACC
MCILPQDGKHNRYSTMVRYGISISILLRFILFLSKNGSMEQDKKASWLEPGKWRPGFAAFSPLFCLPPGWI